MSQICSVTELLSLEGMDAFTTAGRARRPSMGAAVVTTTYQVKPRMPVVGYAPGC